MTTIDLLILVVLVGGLIRGISTGAIRQVVSFVGFLLTFLLATKLMDPVGGLVADSLGLSARIAPVVGFVVVFLAIQVALAVLIRAVESIMGALKLSILNRLLGGVLGALKAALALGVLFLFLGYLDVPSEETRRASVLYQPISDVLPEVWGA